MVSLGYDLIMVAAPGSATLQTFQAYLQFAPTTQQLDTIINLNNTTGSSAQALGTLGVSDGAAWGELYAKTKVNKVIVKYMPACTQGMGGLISATGTSPVLPAGLTFSSSAVMYTIPIYDNVDNIIDDLGKLVPAPTQTALNTVIQKPYTKAHSIYKPWTRVLTPKEYMTYNSYQGGDVYAKRGGFFDLTNPVIRLNGLYIGMESISVGGLYTNVGLNAEGFPTAGQAFNLGQIQIQIYQSFKVRT